MKPVAPAEPPPPKGSVWERVDKARVDLHWSERDLGDKALGNPSGYTKIKARGWDPTGTTLERILHRLEAEGFSRAWLLLAQLPSRSRGGSKDVGAMGRNVIAALVKEGVPEARARDAVADVYFGSEPWGSSELELFVAVKRALGSYTRAGGLKRRGR